MPSDTATTILSAWAGAGDPEDDPLLALDLPSAEPAAGTPTRAREPVHPKFVSTALAAALLGLSIDTVRRMIKVGRLRAVKWGNSPQARWKIPVGELERLGDTPPPAGDL